MIQFDSLTQTLEQLRPYALVASEAPLGVLTVALDRVVGCRVLRLVLFGQSLPARVLPMRSWYVALPLLVAFPVACVRDRQAVELLDRLCFRGGRVTSLYARDLLALIDLFPLAADVDTGQSVVTIAPGHFV